MEKLPRQQNDRSETKGGVIPPEQLVQDIRGLIEAGRQRAAQAVNTELVLLH